MRLYHFSFLSWFTILPCLRCLDDFHDGLDSLTLYVLHVTHSFHSLRFIEKYVIVVVSVCFSLMSLDLSLALFFLFCPGVQKAKCEGIWCVIIFSYFLTLIVFFLFQNYPFDINLILLLLIKKNHLSFTKGKILMIMQYKHNSIVYKQQ